MSAREHKPTGILFENDPQPEQYSYQEKSYNEYKIKFVWKNVFYMLYFHISAVYGLYLLLTNKVKIATVIYG